MNYEKYNNALEKAKVRYNEIKDTDCSEKKFLLDLFPELAESEDERIRKRLIEFFEDWGETKSHCWGKSVNKILDWLEKQKSVSEIVERCKNSWYNEGKIAGQFEGITDDEKYQQGWHDALEKQGEQKHTDIVEPKFKVGDWIVNNEDGSIGQITDIIYDESGYGYNHTNGWLHSVFEKDYHLWTIQDAKDGDVLATDGMIFIFKIIHGIWLSCYCSIHQDGSINESPYDLMTNKYFNEVHPATKEQRELLFKKMKESGYEWNPDTKELKQVEKKIAWSEDDEEFYNDIIKYFSDLDYSLSHEEEYVINWIKSLKERLI